VKFTLYSHTQADPKTGQTHLFN